MLDNSARVDSAPAGRGKTLIPSIQAARSYGLMLLHSLLTLGEEQCALTDVSKMAENSVKPTMRGAIPAKNMGWDRVRSTHYQQRIYIPRVLK